jgi:2-keto-4-pentenoate hydratase/2-oxohepta-3-ene-1,7-dioic acid hydratase in catechol pathway
MRLASFEYEGRERVGFAVDEGLLVGLDDAWRAAGLGPAPETLLALVEGGSAAGAALAQAYAAVRASPSAAIRIPASEIRWRPPVRRPSKIVGVALNNSAFAPVAHRYFEKPAFFLKPPSCLIGHGEPIEVGANYGLTHPEAELACVIGRRARCLDPSEALGAVFGYAIFDDITSPGMKDEDSVHLQVPAGARGGTPPDWRALRSPDDRDVFLTYHARSKGADTFGPMGPWLVTADEVRDPNSLGVRVFLGDELVTEDHTGQLSFPVSEVLAHLSAVMTLEPGDVVHFGTAVNPVRYGLRDVNLHRLGGPVAIEIDGLGRLENPVVHLS